MDSSQIAAISKLICKKRGYHCVDDDEPLEEICRFFTLSSLNSFRFASPEINRGTFLRSRVIRGAVDVFGRQDHQKKLIINFGAGLDTLAWRKTIQGIKYIEIDRSKVCKFKIKSIKSSQILKERLNLKNVTFYEDMLLSEDYIIYPCDLSEFSIHDFIKMCQIKTKMSVLMIFECILMYLRTDQARKLINSFHFLNCSHLSIVIFEPTNISDNFGLIMKEKLAQTDDIKFSGHSSCISINSLLELFNKCDYKPRHVSSCLMKDILAKLDQKSLNKFKKIEPLDEQIVMDTLFKHYIFIILTYSDSNGVIIKLDSLINEI